RTKKVRIGECDENGARMRKRGVAYRSTRCNNFGHTALSCKSKTQDPKGLKRKRKPPKGNAEGNASTGQAQGNANTEPVEGNATTEAVVGTVGDAVGIDASQSLFDEISDEVMATIP
ncbi:hypothetical protein A2U01_0042163, partial [Trifolium medium]|nr:hypothetical protein [Trifolium medium]